MRRDKKNKKAAVCNVPMALACVLLCLTLLTTHFTGGLYARYTISDEASDSARVASFGDVKLVEELNGEIVTDTTRNVIVTPGVDIDKKVYVEFTGAEMDTYIFAAVEPGEGWEVTENKYTAGSCISWSVEEEWQFLKKDNEEYIYWIKIEANETLTRDAENEETETAKYIMKVINVEPCSESELISALENSELKFRAVAVQANGFSSETDPVSAAWDSVNN